MSKQRKSGNKHTVEIIALITAVISLIKGERFLLAKG